MGSELTWLNEPPSWRDEAGLLTVTTGDRTDFWRETHYGFIRDDGHFRFMERAGDFTAEIEFSGDYRHLYDQAGMMLRLDSRNWVKAGIEYVGGRQMLSVVVTRDYSDWSTMPAPENSPWMRLRLSRRGAAIRIEWATAEEDDSRYRLLRLAYLEARDPAMVGPMCCSPERAGFEARFRGFAVRPWVDSPLHD